MHAAVLTKLNSPLEIRHVQPILPLETGQVLVRVIMSGLCGSQLHEIAGHKGNEKFLPHLMGHEGCGVVEAVGPGVRYVELGQKVVMHWRVGNGIESAFPRYALDDTVMSSGRVNTLTEYAVVSENRLTAVPKNTPPELCCLLGCSMTTAFGIINNEVDLKFGENVMIIGCGGVGLNLAQAARIAGAGCIYGVDANYSKAKRDLVMNAGVDIFLGNSFTDDVDVIIDTTGNNEVISKALNCLSGDGRLIMVGQPKPGTKFEVDGNALFNGNGRMIKATQGGKTNPSIDIPKYVAMHKFGLIDWKKIVTDYFDLGYVNDAFDKLKSGDAGRVMIRISEDVK